MMQSGMLAEKFGINYEESTKHSAECLALQKFCTKSARLQDPTNHTAEIQNI